MKTQTITYTYDPMARALTVFVDGKPRGGFIGPDAETRFNGLLLSGAQINMTDMDTKSNHNARVRQLRALWIKQGIDQYRDAILEPYGVGSTADLNDAQLDELINRYDPGALAKSAATPEIRALRSELLGICQQMGIYQTNNDWGKVNAFFMNKKIAGKMLWQLGEPELLMLRRKLHSILGKYNLDKLDRGRKEIMN